MRRENQDDRVQNTADAWVDLPLNEWETLPVRPPACSTAQVVERVASRGGPLMNQSAIETRLTEARADFRWLARAGLLNASREGWRDFLAGYGAMKEFYEAREALQLVSNVA